MSGARRICDTAILGSSGPGQDAPASDLTDPSANVYGCSDQGDQGRPGAAWKRCRGTEKSAEDLVGPPERMESEQSLRG